MYQIRKINYLDDSFEIVLDNIYDAGMAYELASEYHVATMGLSKNKILSEKFRGTYAIMITDKQGNSKWHECCNERRPMPRLFVQ